MPFLVWFEHDRVQPQNFMSKWQRPSIPEGSVDNKICNALKMCWTFLSSSLSGSKKVNWSYLQGPRDTPLLGVTIGQLLEERAEQHPDKLAVAVRHQQKRLTFEQLLEEVSKNASEHSVYFCSYSLFNVNCSFKQPRLIVFCIYQIWFQSDQLAAGLLALGVKRGDRVGIWAPNCLEWLLTQFGTARAGMIMVGLFHLCYVPVIKMFVL